MLSGDHKKLVDKQAHKTLAEKVEALQERARKLGAALYGSNDKAFIDEGWGEDSNPPSCEAT